MAKEELQKVILTGDDGLLFSSRTLNLQHLLAQAYDTLVSYELTDGKHGVGDLKTSILECFEPSTNYYGTMEDVIAHNNSLFTSQYHGRCELVKYKHGDIALDPADVWDACCNYFQNLAPEGYYFGDIEGDSSCIGWFKYPENESEVDYSDVPPGTDVSYP